MSKVSVIIPNYNGETFLPTCLHSLLKSSFRSFEVIIIDDGSTDESLKIIEKLQRKSKKIRLYQNKTNTGASASRNLGLKYTKGEIIVFLDNDTRVDQHWLRELVKPLLAHNIEIGATCSKTLIFQRPSVISTAGLLLIPHTGWGIAKGGGDKNGTLKWEKPAETVAISAALAVKKQVIEKIGGFDEKLAVHTEDLDFCWRIWLSGYKILYVPSSFLFHWSKSVDQRAKLMSASKSFIYFHINKNTIRTLLKNYSVEYLCRYLPVGLAIIWVRGLIVLISQGDFSALWTAFTSLLWNLINLPDTLRTRTRVQSLRRVSDGYLYAKIMTNESLLNIYRKYFQ